MKAVDTTGAGDSFVGSLLRDVARDPSILEVCFLSLKHNLRSTLVTEKFQKERKIQ